ncbi:MAG: cytochrome c peroxidase [Alteromonadaceae bacterium]|jgi:cytochrome c peroxidase
MPQIGNGNGKGDGDGSADFGRFRETTLEADKFAFRTSTILNIKVTGPYTHAGSYTSLEEVIKHHANPAKALANYDFSQLQQSGISNLDKMQNNTQEALDKLTQDRLDGLNVLQDVELSNEQVSQLVDFMRALTDPCVTDKTCMAKWVPTKGEDPNGDQLDGIDANGEYL